MSGAAVEVEGAEKGLSLTSEEQPRVMLGRANYLFNGFSRGVA
jgi:hypothetical protein